MKPALSAEEWRSERTGLPRFAMATCDQDELSFTLERPMGTKAMCLQITASDPEWKSRVLTTRLADPETLHALAALALHGQPFGFGREDVTLLREADLDSFRDESGAVQDEHPQRAKLSALADRIAALLPPEEGL